MTADRPVRGSMQAYTSCLSMGRKEEAGKWAQRAYELLGREANTWV